VVRLAAPLSSASGNVRACCPLCGEGTSSPYDVGFAFPDGLQRHLVGALAAECRIMRAIRELIIDDLPRSEVTRASIGPRFDPVRKEWKD
jgi:hypothetical protein